MAADNPALPSLPEEEPMLAATLHPRAGIYQAKLTTWAKYAAARFNADVYLVGSALTTDDPRDVDLRIIMDYDAYWARFGQTPDGSRSWTWVREVAKLSDYATRDLAGEGNYCHSVDVQIDNDVAMVRHKDKERVLLASPTVGAHSAPSDGPQEDRRIWVLNTYRHTVEGLLGHAAWCATGAGPGRECDCTRAGLLKELYPALPSTPAPESPKSTPPGPPAPPVPPGVKYDVA